MRNDVGKFVCLVSSSASGFRVSYRSGFFCHAVASMHLLLVCGYRCLSQGARFLCVV